MIFRQLILITLDTPFSGISFQSFIFNKYYIVLIFFKIIFHSIFQMSNKKSKKLWKDIGTTKQKYDRDSQRSPSFDRSSLARSNQGRSQSSHSVRLTKRKQQFQKNQIKNQLEQAMKNFVSTNLHDLGMNLMAVPEQEDVHNSHISFKNDNDSHQHGEDDLQLHLLNEIFSKNTKIRKGKKLKKQDVPILKESVKNLSMYHLQISKYIKFSLNNFKNQIYKMDRKMKEIISKMTKELFLKSNLIAKLTVQNNQLKKQLMSAFDMIEQLQNINSTTISSNMLLKSRRSLNMIESLDINRQKNQDDDRTVKYTNNRKNQNQHLNDQISQYHYKSTGFSQIKHMKLNENIAEENNIKRKQQQGQQNSQLSKRQKFKKFINQRHQKKNEIKRQIQRQNKFDSLTDQGISSVKYYRNTQNVVDEKEKRYQITAQKSPFSLQVSGLIEEKFCKNRMQNSSQLPKTAQKINVEKPRYPITRSNRINNK